MSRDESAQQYLDIRVHEDEDVVGANGTHDEDAHGIQEPKIVDTWRVSQTDVTQTPRPRHRQTRKRISIIHSSQAVTKIIFMSRNLPIKRRTNHASGRLSTISDMPTRARKTDPVVTQI